MMAVMIKLVKYYTSPKSQSLGCWYGSCGMGLVSIISLHIYVHYTHREVVWD